MTAGRRATRFLSSSTVIDRRYKGNALRGYRAKTE
jgi:hypothetical protein